MLRTEGTCDHEVLKRFKYAKVEINFYRRASARELARTNNPNLVKVHGIWMHKARHTFNVPTEFGNIAFTKTARNGPRSKYKADVLTTSTHLDTKSVSKIVKDDIEHFFRQNRNSPPHILFYELDECGQPKLNANGKKIMRAKYFYGAHGKKANF